MKINKPKDGMMWRHTQTVSGNEQDGNICNYCLEKVDNLLDGFGCYSCIEKYK